MGFRVNHPLLRVAIVAMIERVADDVEIPIRIALCDDCIPDGMHKSSVPLGGESCSSLISAFRYPLVILQILRDRDLPRLRGTNFIVDPLQEAPTIGQVATIDAADVAYRIETQTVQTVFVQPKE